MSKPIAVLISDVHYNLQTLELADAAMRMAIDKANELQVPLIVAGDLHDTKANMRAECVNAMLNTFNTCRTKCYIMIGNHDLINEKSEQNALEFLYVIGEPLEEGYLKAPVELVRKPWFYNNLGAINGNSIHLIPYHSDPDKLRMYLAKIDPNSCIIMHQGLQGSNSGDYYQDHSALTLEDVKDFRVISGHYHRRQDIKTGRPRKGAVGLFSYIGNPYTMNFGEANDPPKGFQILMDDGLLEFVPTNLRKHVKIVIDLDVGYQAPYDIGPNDLVWVQLYGTKEQLQNFDKRSLELILGSPFKLELIEKNATTTTTYVSQTQPELLDQIIDSTQSEETAKRLKALWRSL